MTAAKVKLTIEQGATYRKVFTWMAGDPPTPVDLTGRTARMHIREELSASTPLWTLTTENGGIALGGATGTVTLTILPADSSAFTWTMGVYDLEIVSSPTEVFRLASGAVVVIPEVTRD